MESLSIDIGTYNLCAVVSNNGQQIIIRDPDSGNTVIPSIIKYNPDGSVRGIGSAIAERYRTDPFAVRCVKRIIGYKMDSPEMREYQKSCIRDVIKGKDGFPAFKIDCFPDNSLTPVKVTTHMIRYIADLASEKINKKKIGELVITVPAFFTTQQRKHTKDAAVAAGICDEQNIHIVSEPVAAAIHYGVIRPQTQTIMVVDFGGGTLDLCIMRIDNKKFNVVGTKGDRCLGGEDITKKLASFIEKKYYDVCEKELIWAPKTSKLYEVIKEKLKIQAEKAKIELSTKETYNVDLTECSRDGFLKEDNDSDSDSDSDMCRIHHNDEEEEEPMCIDITRKELNEVMKRFMERILNLIDDLLRETKLQSVDRIVMVGGSCRIPLVKERLCERFGENLVEWDEQYLETAVALGAYQATEIAMKKSGIEYSEILPYHYGIIIDDTETHRDIFKTIIPKGTKIPCETQFEEFFAIPQGVATDRNPTLGIEIPVKRSEDGVSYSYHIHDPFVIEAKNTDFNGVYVKFYISRDGMIFFEVIQKCDGAVLVEKKEICCINADL